MGKIWQLTKNRFADLQNAYRFFIFLSVFLWTVPLFLAVLAGCVILHTPTLQTISISLSVSGISGVLIGFFGSLLYLMRNN